MLKQRSGSNMEIPKSFLGYKRENGRAGTRNHVIILPVDDISNACAEAVANNIKGTIALPHSYGRLQFGADLELHFRTMIGTGKNPNVAAVIVIGIEPKWTKRIVDAIAKTGKPVVVNAPTMSKYASTQFILGKIIQVGNAKNMGRNKKQKIRENSCETPVSFKSLFDVPKITKDKTRIPVKPI